MTEMTDAPEFTDKNFLCVDCGNTFTFTIGEQQFYWSKGLLNPKRCKACRVLRRRNISLDMGVKDD